MSKNIFHIGYHKTATTWFQKKLYPHVSNFDIAKRSLIRSFFYEDKMYNFDNASDIIFCDEELSGNIHNAGHSGFLTKQVARKIGEFNNPKVVIFLRNQYDIISSSYLQYVKEGGNYSINKYVYHKEYLRSNRVSLFSFKHFNYYNLISNYIEIVGKKNVHIYLYEDFASNQKSFIKEFCDTHDLKINLEKIDFTRTNNSYSYISYYLAKFINSFSHKNVLYKYYILHIPFLYEYARFVLSRINIFPINRRSILSKKIKRDIDKFYKESNNKISSEFGLDLKKYNYPT